MRRPGAARLVGSVSAGSVLVEDESGESISGSMVDGAVGTASGTEENWSSGEMHCGSNVVVPGFSHMRTIRCTVAEQPSFRCPTNETPGALTVAPLTRLASFRAVKIKYYTKDPSPRESVPELLSEP